MTESVLPALKKRYARWNEYSFPETEFRTAMSLARAGNMGRSVISPERRKFYDEIGIDPSAVRTLRQVHSKNIINSVLWHDDCEGDGIYSVSPHETLGITSADCVPVFIFHSKIPLFGAFHSGWKGTGIVKTGLERIAEETGVPPGDLSAFIGPSIGGCCYDVDDERGASFFESFGGSAAVKKNGKWFLDLREANIRILSKAGTAKIYVDRDCTCCNRSYGSYRRQGPEDFDLMLSLGGYWGLVT